MIKTSVLNSKTSFSEIKIILSGVVLCVILIFMTGCKPENIFSDTEMNYNKAVKMYESKNPWNRRKCFPYFEAAGDQRSVAYLIKALEDKDYEMRKAAMYSLVRLQGANAAQYILVLLSDNDASVRAEAEKVIGGLGQSITLFLMKDINTYNKKKKINIIRAMGIIKDISFIDTLGSIVVDGRDPSISVEAINALGNIKYNVANKYIVKGFNNRSPQVVIAALKSINKNGSPELVYTIRPMLGNPNKQIVDAAIEALGDNGNEKAAPLLINKIKECSSDNECIDKITQALSKVGKENNVIYYLQALEMPEVYIRIAVLKSATLQKRTPWAKKVIIAASQNASSQVKSMALFALKDSSGSKGMKQLLASLNDPDPKIKADAILALSEYTAAKNYKGEYVTFLHSKDFTIQLAAIKAVTRIKEAWTLEELKRLIETSPEPDVKIAVLDALVSYGNDKNIVKYIGQYLKASDERVASAAIDALLRIGGINARREFLSNLEDSNPDIRLRSVRALDAIGDFAALSVLQKLRNDKDEKVKAAATKAVEAIFKRKEVRDNLPISTF